jgi:N-sulfoglucosamine sulfohydrolase
MMARLHPSRNLIAILAWCVLALAGGVARAQLSAPVKRPNILMIVADDMNWDSPGCFGGAAEGITPNIDKLASEGMRFLHAYVNISICTPSRSVMLTGLYPHKNRAEGFQRIRPGTPTLPAILNEAGYMCGTVGKPLSQEEIFRWSVAYRWPGAGDEDRWGRDPAVYGRFCREFFAMAKTAHQPFFLMASSHDPHHPFGRGKATRKPNERAEASKIYRADEVNLHGLLPDLPGVREEYANYCTSVRRLDDMAGVVLDELERAELVDDTLVLFLADHGMDFPGAKMFCYPNSVRTPLVVRWPGKVAPGAVDKEHMVSMIDLQPTLLEAVDLEPMNSDGRSFVPLLRGDSQSDRDAIFAQFYHIHGKDALPMRSVITRDATYVFNPWSDGRRQFKRLSGSVVAAMKTAAKDDPSMAARIKHLRLRTVEEFYDLGTDSNCLTNLIGSGRHEGQIEALRTRLHTWMTQTGDPALKVFDQRDQSDALDDFVEGYRASAQKVKDALRAYEKRKGYRF